MQIRAEEQDDDDKKGIALAGMKKVSIKNDPHEVYQ